MDFFVEQKVMVEIKALIQLEDVHLAQAMNYLEAYGLEVGLLINFGARSLQFKRVMRAVREHREGRASNHGPSSKIIPIMVPEREIDASWFAYLLRGHLRKSFIQVNERASAVYLIWERFWHLAVPRSDFGYITRLVTQP